MSRKRQADNGPGSIPDRWLHCPRKASALIAERFFAFKTPLDDKFDSQMDAEYFFHPEMVFQSAKYMKKKLGLWIDLTNTSRFYDKAIVDAMDCRYVKLSCRGHGETPSEETVKTFVQMCSNFISSHPLQLIGIHCTHGFNRTGFLIVSYLVSALDWSVEAAVAEFAKARPPGIYKADYIEKLFEIYGDIEDAPQAPPLPNWHTESDDGPSNDGAADDNEVDDDDASESAGTSGGPKKKKRREQVQLKATFMEGIPNVSPVTDIKTVHDVQKRIKTLTGFNQNGFPGAQPVSMDRQNMALLEHPYMVSWKADGTRYMMYIKGMNEVFFIDRDNAVFRIDGLSFFHRSDPRRHLVDTLVDGEMVIDVVKIKEGKDERHPRYLIYDLVSFEGNQIAHEQFTVRYRAIQKEIVEPRIQAMKEGRIFREREPIGIRRKDFWELETTSYLLSDRFRDKLGHEPDGLIFQPSDESYQPGQCPNILKWKPPSHNSIDFRVKIVKEDRPGMLRETLGNLYVGGQDVPFAQMKATRAMQPYDNRIIECRWEFGPVINGQLTGKWVFMRERTDKSFPNSYKTAQAVWQSIKEPVTKQILTNFVDSLKKSDDFAMPPPPAAAQRRSRV